MSTEGPFEYYNQIHPGVDGASIRAAAHQPGSNAAVIQALAGELEGDQKKVAGQVEGDIEAGTTTNPQIPQATATDLAAKGQYAVGLLNLFASQVDTFDKEVDRLNGLYQTRLSAALTAAHHDPDVRSGDATVDRAGIGKAIEADLRGEYTKALTKLDDDADSIATKFKQGPKPENVRDLIRSGLMPLTSAALYGLTLTHDDKQAYYKSLFATMTDAQQVAYIKNLLNQPRIGPQGGPILDPDLIAAVSPGAQQIIGNEVADDIKSKNIDADTVTMLSLFSQSAPFAHTVMSNVSPDQLSDAIKKLGEDAYPNGHRSSDADDAKVAFYKGFLTATGQTFATYTKGTGAWAPPSDLSDQYFKAITSDHDGEGAALTLMLRAGGQTDSFEPHFLSDLTDKVYDWEKDQDGPVWGPRDDNLVVNPFLTTDDHMFSNDGGYVYATDGMANLLGAMEHSPDAAKDFFSDGSGGVDDDKMKYLLTERTFSGDKFSDEGEGLGAALQAAAIPDRNDPSDTTWSAKFTSEMFNTIADKSGSGDDFGPDDVWHMWPGMADNLGTVGAAYSSDIYDAVQGDPAQGDGHLDVSLDNLDKMFGEIGRGDKTGIEILSAGVMVEGNDRIHDAIVQYRQDHPGEPITMDALSRSGLSDALSGVGGDNGEVLGHILNKSVLVDVSDEDIAKTRAEYVSKAIDIASGFIPGGGDVLGETASHLAKAGYDTVKDQGIDGIKSAVESTADATSGEYVRDSRSSESDALKYNTMNQLIREGYLTGPNGIPDSLLVTASDGNRVINPDLYDSNGVDKLAANGSYSADQQRTAWHDWYNSTDAQQARAITGDAADGFDREVNKEN